MVEYEIVNKEELRMVKATLNGDTVRAESGALHYMIGNIEMVTKAPSVGGFLKSVVSSEDIFRPTYTGTGEVFFGPPTFGEYHILELNGNSMVLDQGAYICSDEGIEVGIMRNKGVKSMLFGGEGIWQTTVSGTGKVVYYSDGPIEEITLENDTLTVDGNFAVARDSSLNYETKLLGKGLLSKMAGGEGFVNVISGTGKVYLSPVPSRFNNLISRQVSDTVGGMIPLPKSRMKLQEFVVIMNLLQNRSLRSDIPSASHGIWRPPICQCLADGPRLCPAVWRFHPSPRWFMVD